MMVVATRAMRAVRLVLGVNRRRTALPSAAARPAPVERGSRQPRTTLYADRQQGKKSGLDPCGSIALVAIKAVVFDIGGVLEIIDDSVFPGRWPGRLGLEAYEFLRR